MTKDGRRIFCEWYNTTLIDDDGEVVGVASLAQDVTEQRQAEQRLHYMAYFDSLTGLPNRTLFTDRLAQAIADAKRYERRVGVMFINVDHFKNVNETLGHHIGDELLRAVAQRLAGSLRASDTVAFLGDQEVSPEGSVDTNTIAYLGSDEFAIILSGLSSPDAVVQVAHKIYSAFRQPFQVTGNELFLTLSMGITQFPNDGQDIQGLLRNADSALHQAKSLGRNNFQFYSTEMTARAVRRMDMETGLRHALERDEFVLHYQPRVDLRSGQVVGLEALIRWHHPDKGMISPGEFIPIAEETGMIVPIGAWALRTACAQAKAWQEDGLPRLIMAVNLSARQFRQTDLVEQVRDTLMSTGLDPACLELEITESLLIDGTDSPVLKMLEAFKAMGISLAIDDFGTGYSSLSYLKRFPIDTLKIDRAFVQGVSTDPEDASLVKAIIALARSLKLQVIAEGVETEAQYAYLRQHDCDHMQGFFFSRPLPVEACAEVIRSHA